MHNLRLGFGAVVLGLALAACSSSSKVSDKASNAPTSMTTSVAAGSSTTAGAGAGAGATATTQPSSNPTTPPTAPPTAPPTTPTTTATPTTSPSHGAQVTSISGASATFHCESGPGFTSPTSLTLQWTTSGATSVTVAIDNPNGPFETGLPPNGSLSVPAPCAPNTNTYYVEAIGADGSKTIKSVTTKGV